MLFSCWLKSKFIYCNIECNRFPLSCKKSVEDFTSLVYTTSILILSSALYLGSFITPLPSESQVNAVNFLFKVNVSDIKCSLSWKRPLSQTLHSPQCMSIDWSLDTTHARAVYACALLLNCSLLSCRLLRQLHRSTVAVVGLESGSWLLRDWRGGWMNLILLSPTTYCSVGSYIFGPYMPVLAGGLQSGSF